MRLSHKLGLKLPIHSFGISGYSPGVLQIVFWWCTSGIGVVEGRPTPVATGKGEADIYDCDITHKQPASAINTRGTVQGPGPSDPPLQNSSRTSLVDPINISLATIGAIAGVIILGVLFYKFYSKWSILGNEAEPLWPPHDAAREEVVQLVELIRMGMIDAHGAPPHVINWVLYGADAPWPPPGGVRSLQRGRRRRQRRRAAATRPRGGGDGSIELPPRTQHRRNTSRPFTATPSEPLPLYVRDANLDANHYPITILPPDFPPLPSDLLPSTPELLASPEVHRTISSTPSSQSSMNEDGDSETGSRWTVALREHDDPPLTGLTPRPPPPAILPPPA